MKKILSIILTGVMLFALVGCGSGKEAGTSKKALTAEDYGNKLKEAGLAVDNISVTTEENDENKLMGRPNQYTSRIKFDNGSIEVFANKEDTNNRKEYIESISKKISFLAEYEYVNENAILRINGKVSPDDAKKYEDEFQKIK